MMTQDGPWSKYQTSPAIGTPTPSSPPRIVGAPKTPDAAEQERLRLARNADARSASDQLRQDRIAPLQEQALTTQVANAQAQQGKVVFDQQQQLRDDYEKHPAVKSFQAVVPLYMSALKAADGSAGGDLQLLYAFPKVMDPGSVVRGEEQDMVQAADPYVRSLMAKANQQIQGTGSLSPQLRLQLLQQMRMKGAAFRHEYDVQRHRFEADARAAGLDPERVIGPDPARSYGIQELELLARHGDEGARAEVIRRAKSPTDNYGNPTGGGEFAFNDQVPEQIQGYRMTPDQEAKIAAAIGVGDEGQALALMEQFSGYRPSAASIEGVRTAIKTKGRIQFNYADVDAARQAELRAKIERQDELSGKPSDLGLLATQGGAAGFGDEIAGASSALGAVIAGKDPVKAYNSGRDATLLRLDDARQRQGWTGTAAEIGGGLATPVGALGRTEAGASLAARIGQGAKAGAIGGSLSGAGYSEGSNRLLNGALGGTGGALAGGALPVVGEVVGGRVNALNRLMGRDATLPRRLASEAIEADGNTPRVAGAMMQEAQGRGSPMSLADTGDNARQLLASVGRQPGPARTLTQEAVVGRQMAQQERIAAAVRRDLGETANIRDTSDRLIEEARTAAGPLYEQAYAAPGASSVRIDDLLQRPSVRQALTRAHRLAAEEGVDPNTLGFTLNAAGEPELTRVPSFQTLDYVKRGLDDVVETYRDKVTGQLRLDGEGRSINNTLRALLSRIDRVNPAYRAARDAYAGPARLNEALQKGVKALNRAPDDLSAEIRQMSEPELEMYRLGLRKSITDFLETRTDGADKVQALIGTPKKRAALARAFGGRAEYDRFIATLGDEAHMGQTYRAVAGNSATAMRQAFDQTTNDSGLAESALDTVLRGGKEGFGAAAIAGIQRLREVGRFGAGEAGQRTRESVAALLTETDPALLRELVRAAQRARALQRVRDRRGVGPRKAIASGIGEQIGSGVNALLPSPQPVEK